MALLLAGMMAPAAFAGLDPATDSFGVYFDAAGNTNCTTASAWQVVTAYLILMNPAGPTHGFECSVALVGAPHFVLSTVYNVNCGTDPGWSEAPGDLTCGGVVDFPVPANGAVVLVTWSIILVQDSSELLFYLGPASIPSLPGGLPVVAGDGGVLRLCGVASGDVNLPVAGINASNCPVSDEVTAFGAVKGLFR
jgi:hypothetical protein